MKAASDFLPYNRQELDKGKSELKSTLKKGVSKIDKGIDPLEKNPYPRNSEVNKFIDAITDMKINATMSEVTKASAQKIAGYLDFISGYWPDYENHVVNTVVTAEDIREATRDSAKGGKEWDHWPKEVQNKVVKHAQREHRQRVSTVKQMGSFLARQQETMAQFSPEASARMEEIQDNLAA